MYCTKCGTQLRNGAEFCQNCGLPKGDYSMPQASPPLEQSRKNSVKPQRRKSRIIPIVVAISVVVFAGLGLISLMGDNDAGGKLSLTKDLETVIKPSGEVAIVNYQNYKIHIPGDTVQKEEKLVISKVSGAPKAMEGLTELCPPFDVKLGGLKEFMKPIIIEIPYDKAKTGGLSPTDAFIAVYYNEAMAKWVDVPYVVDTASGVVQLQMYHLTTVQCYYSYWEGARVYDNGSALVIFNLNEEARKTYSEYEQDTGKTAADPTRPQMVVDAADYANKIIKAYQDAGLTLSGKPKIYLTTKNNYNSSSGNLSLDMNITFDSDPEKMVARNIAHELFHKAQQDTLGSYAYNKTIFTNTSFWLEATADYMANKGVWDLLGEPPANKFETYGVSFFEKELFAMDGSHEYAAADFIRFVVAKQGATPLQLVKLAEESSVLSGLNFENRFNAIFKNAAYSDLPSYYEGFLEYSLFDNSSKYSQRNNAQMEGAFNKHTELKFEPDAAGKAKNPVLEGKGEISIPDTFTAGFYRFTSDNDATLEITGDTPLVMYSVNRTRQDRGLTKRVAVSGGVPASISFSKDDFVVLAATGGVNKTVSFKYKAVPLTMSAREVSGLIPLKIQFPNGVIPTAKQNSRGMRVSISKWAQAEKYNLQFYNMGSLYEDANYNYELSNLNIINPVQFLLKGNSDGTLYVEGEAELEYKYWTKYGTDTKMEHQTLPISATLTPNNEGYDIRIHLNGIITEGKLK